MSISQIDSNIVHSIDRIRQIIIDLDENIQDKYNEYYPQSDPTLQAFQNLDVDGFTDYKNQIIPNIKFYDTFIKDIHNILDVYNLCSSSFAQQLDKIGIQQIQMFCKQLMLSHRKSMIFALRVVCSHYKVPQVVDERKFKIPTYEIEKEIVKEANAKKYNYKKVKIQKGTVDKDLVELIKKHLIDKPELVPESLKAKLGQIYDPLLKEYREAEQVMNETLLNKNKFLNLQPSNCGNFVSNTLKQIEGTTMSFYNFEQITLKGNKNREELNSLTNEFYSNMIMEELSKEIKDNFEESARKRMQAVILQVIQFLRKQNQIELPSIQCQTELTMEDIDKQIQDAEKEARACRWELEAIKSNIRTLSLKNEELQRDLDFKNKKIQEQNQQIIDHISSIEKLKNEITQLDIQYELKFKKRAQELEQKQKQFEIDFKNQENAQNKAQKKTYAHSFTQTGKVVFSNGENNHIYASQKHYTQFKRRYSHDLQLEGRVDYFYLLQRIKDDLEKHPMKRKKLNIPQDVNLRTENRAFTKMQKQLQILQKIKEEEQEILNLRQQQQVLPQISNQQIQEIKNANNASIKKQKEVKDLQVKGTSSQLIPQDQLEYLLNQYKQTKSTLQSQQNQQMQTDQIESHLATEENSSKIKQTSAENLTPSKFEQSSQLKQKIQNTTNAEQQTGSNTKEVFRYIEELKKSQGELFKNFSQEQIDEIEQFIISKELGVNHTKAIPQNGISYVVDQNGNIQEQSAQDIQLLFDEYNKLKPFQELIQQLQWISSEGERAYVIGILNNYICKLLRRRRQISKRSQAFEYNDKSLSPQSFSLSPEQQSTKKNTSFGRLKTDTIYNEESEKKDGFQSYKQFQDRLKNHQANLSIKKNRQRSCYSFNSPSSVTVYYKNLNEASGNYERFLKDHHQSDYNQSPNKQKTPRDNQSKEQNSQQNDFNSTEQKVRMKRQYSIDRCENLNLPALNIIQKAQEHLQQFQQSVVLQNCKKIHNRILIQKKLKLHDDLSKSKSQKAIKSQISIAPLNEEEQQNFVDFNDENYYQVYKQLTFSHELMLECVQIFQNSNKGQQNNFTNDQAKQLLKQSKYPFQSIQQTRAMGVNNFDATFTIWKNQFQQLPNQLKSYILKKTKQVKK
ncbi:hypothetical protein TTHERM_00471430 (macronuclear) [Tetrahymena thermophila SB210]|uniref:Uncharacterized protein n=1 Tax=Tetrahymena thermophila (strain SB210) TaxID=312017 RepID=I7M6K3_TETTS|nr:hypothetical protein TTHERM_00471430 [Tetrahymena thermophila SB210]EAR85366.2 hypothetical protein TTHERM_00471430 [Tetrahymena thermophila SB210]|eukprot:XP_001033029.2 hypothetical protein TTHERM_00471430 [Tetrahymena thermophila SB210]